MGKRNKQIVPETVIRSRNIWGKPSDVVAATTFLWAAIGERHGVDASAGDELLEECYYDTLDEMLQAVSSAELAPVPIPGGHVRTRGHAVGKGLGASRANQQRDLDDVQSGTGDESSAEAYRPCRDRDSSESRRSGPTNLTGGWYEECGNGVQEEGMCAPVFSKQVQELYGFYKRGSTYDLSASFADPSYRRAVEQLDEYVAASREFRARNSLHDRLSKKMCQSSLRASTWGKFPRSDAGFGVGRREPEEEGNYDNVCHVGSGDWAGQSVGLLQDNADPLWNGLKYLDLTAGTGGLARGGLVISDVAVPNRTNTGLGSNSDLITWVMDLVRKGVRVVYKCNLLDAAHPIVHKARLHNMEVVCDTGAERGWNPIPWIIEANHTRNLFHKGWLQEVWDGVGLSVSANCWQCLWRVLQTEHDLRPFSKPAAKYSFRQRVAIGFVREPADLLWSYVDAWHLRSARMMPDKLAKLDLTKMTRQQIEALLDDYGAKEIAGHYNAQRIGQ
jgi:hypothetical protein